MTITNQPLITSDRDELLKLSPTDLSQFIRLDQCERYLRLRLHERLRGKSFMSDYDVSPQPLPPLLSQTGGSFEDQIENAVAAHQPVINFAASSGNRRDRPQDNEQLIAFARVMRNGETITLFQTRLRVELAHCQLGGDVDIIRMTKLDNGALDILIIDMKSSVEVKIDHRLQVAFYHLMLAELFDKVSISYQQIRTAILYRGGVESGPLDAEAAIKRDQERVAAAEYLSLKNGLLEIVTDPQAYLDSVHDLVTGEDSTTRRIARAEFDSLAFNLSHKCDHCLYNEFCMKWSAEHDDISLLPYITVHDKLALRLHKINKVRELAVIKDLVDKDLIPAAGKEALIKQLATSWPIGPRVDELIHRARRYRKWKKDPIEALPFIPSRSQTSLPYADAEQNANLVRIYLDAQYDYINDRIYLLGALVSACENGVENETRRRAIVHLSDGPPDSAEKERQLFLNWIGETLRAIVELAAPDAEGKPAAPIHVIFYDRSEQRLLLDGLSRHFPAVLSATPLYDFMTQLAAFDSPIASFLDEEIRELKNYPLVCQSLHIVAAFLGFNWNEGERFREIFHARVFDFWGKHEDDNGLSNWYTSHARFNSTIPLEFAYAGWQALPPPRTSGFDEFAHYRAVSLDQLIRFATRRLEAIEYIARNFKGNQLTSKRAFDLPSLASFNDKARTFAHALDEFLTIERHIELNGWKTTRHIEPERRALLGETLITRYLAADQPPEVAARNQENQRKAALKESWREQQLDATEPTELSQDQKDEMRQDRKDLSIRLRIDLENIDCDLNELLALSRLNEGKSLVLYPRFTVDSRLPVAERVEHTPTAKQMLYGGRADLAGIELEHDENGKLIAAFARVKLRNFVPGLDRGYGFASNHAEPFVEGRRYTLDEDPNNNFGYLCARVTEALTRIENGEQEGRNTLYDRIAYPSKTDVAVHWPAAAISGQQRFLAGIDELQNAGALHQFEPSKRSYIGSYGDARVLLVQGPPGTGKSYSTAFALLARMQGAIAADLDFRAIISCKTHAATDTLLKNILEVRDKLLALSKDHAEIFARYFDAHLWQATLFRVLPKESLPPGIIPLVKPQPAAKTTVPPELNSDLNGEANGVVKKRRKPAIPKMADEMMATRWSITAATPGGIYKLITEKWKNREDLCRHQFSQCLVLDEASQMSIPEAAMAALPLAADGQLIVVGDHRQMPPIVKHDWDSEPRRTFQEYKAYQSLFLSLLPLNPPMIKFAESFRLHSSMAEFLRREIYQQDGIDYHSRRKNILPKLTHTDDFVAAVLRPEHPIIAIVHDEASSQMRNSFEQALVAPIIDILTDPGGYNLNARDGLGVVVPHRAQKAAMQLSFPRLSVRDAASGNIIETAVDTVERFQGGERTAILISATESDPQYLLTASRFLLDPRRLTVAMSRAKQKLILVAARSIFSLFSADEEMFINLQLWKNLLRRTCTEKLWDGKIGGRSVTVWGNKN